MKHQPLMFVLAQELPPLFTLVPLMQQSLSLMTKVKTSHFSDYFGNRAFPLGLGILTPARDRINSVNKVTPTQAKVIRTDIPLAFQEPLKRAGPKRARKAVQAVRV